MKLPNLSDITECPECGGTEYYVQQRASGIIRERGSLIGAAVDNHDMYDGLNIKQSVWVYCADCERKIARDDR